MQDAPAPRVPDAGWSRGSAADGRRNFRNMTPLQSIILGIIEGVTEYLPVSSTGHLVVASRLMGIGTNGASAKEAADAFAICIQGGAILAVLGLYWSRVVQMIRGTFENRSSWTRAPISICSMQILRYSPRPSR